LLIVGPKHRTWPGRYLAPLGLVVEEACSLSGCSLAAVCSFSPLLRDELQRQYHPAFPLALGCIFLRAISADKELEGWSLVRRAWRLRIARQVLLNPVLGILFRLVTVASRSPVLFSIGGTLLRDARVRDPLCSTCMVGLGEWVGHGPLCTRQGSTPVVAKHLQRAECHRRRRLGQRGKHCGVARGTRSALAALISQLGRTWIAHGN